MNLQAFQKAVAARVRDIPLLGWLFRYKNDVEEKTNLLVFVTPTIIAAPDDASATSAELQSRAGITFQDARAGHPNGR